MLFERFNLTPRATMTVLVECTSPKLQHARRLSTVGTSKTEEKNPVITSSEYVYKSTQRLVNLNEDGIKAASKYIHSRMSDTSYAPSTWRTQPLHFIPPVPPSSGGAAAIDAYMSQPAVKRTLDWIFFISAMNFSFWSDKSGEERYGVAWYEDGWLAAFPEELESAGLSPTREEYSAVTTTNSGASMTKYTGYWSLPAATNRDPSLCPDSVIEQLFASGREQGSADVESIPLLAERINVLRRVSKVLCTRFEGSYVGLIEAWKKKYGDERTALQLVQMVVEEFEDFRDEVSWKGKKGMTPVLILSAWFIMFLKRAQILLAETWAAFHPLPSQANTQHPIFPNGIGQLTMFADYRVPQILYTLGIIDYAPEILAQLKSGQLLPYGSESEVAIRAASILAVERVKEAIVDIRGINANSEEVTSVLIDFFLWDLAKDVEAGDVILGESRKIPPVHRTRSIWY
ncbi:hypothetical protein FRC04_007366 [Tulasnella sp. 424]|nr:hypothetical protein FRC04_007366 [Tulasnella sp. 424]KAG8971598.1 hypothetical protein FRC05_010944 [Tulasnella sp. 425]